MGNQPGLFSEPWRQQPDSRSRAAGFSEPLPRHFRERLLLFWDQVLGSGTGQSSATSASEKSVWRSIHDQVAKARGVRHLDDPDLDESRQCRLFLLKADTRGALDLIEASLQAIDHDRKTGAAASEHGTASSDVSSAFRSDEVLNEFNQLCREFAIGYEYAGGELVPVESRFLHTEVVQPALVLLRETGFEQASRQFLAAFDHYDQKRYADAITGAGRAFESTIKAICQARGWPHDSDASASKLVEILFENELVPAALQSQFGQLRGLIGSGLMSLRNRMGAHGPAPNAPEVPDYIAAYCLHLSAANIVFLVRAHLHQVES